MPSERYVRELKVVGDPERFAAAESVGGQGMVRPALGSGQDLLELLDEERRADPEEPLWQGVRGMRAERDAVRIDFADRVVPTLRPVPGSGVEVSCHLHHDPAPR